VISGLDLFLSAGVIRRFALNAAIAGWSRANGPFAQILWAPMAVEGLGGRAFFEAGSISPSRHLWRIAWRIWFRPRLKWLEAPEDAERNVLGRITPALRGRQPAEPAQGPAKAFPVPCTCKPVLVIRASAGAKVQSLGGEPHHLLPPGLTKAISMRH